MNMFGAEIKVKRYIQALTCGKKTMAQINEPLTPFEKDLLLGITRHSNYWYLSISANNQP
jgi:hypothetical protein